MYECCLCVCVCVAAAHALFAAQLLNLANQFPNLQLAASINKQVLEQSIRLCKDQMNMVQQQLEIAEKNNDQPFITSMQRFLVQGQKTMNAVLSAYDKFNTEFPVIAKYVLLACSARVGWLVVQCDDHGLFRLLLVAARVDTGCWARSRRKSTPPSSVKWCGDSCPRMSRRPCAGESHVR